MLHYVEPDLLLPAEHEDEGNDAHMAEAATHEDDTGPTEIRSVRRQKSLIN